MFSSERDVCMHSVCVQEVYPSGVRCVQVVRPGVSGWVVYLEHVELLADFQVGGGHDFLEDREGQVRTVKGQRGQVETI